MPYTVETTEHKVEGRRTFFPIRWIRTTMNWNVATAPTHQAPPHHDGNRALYITSGALFVGLAGVFLFAAPGGVIGAILGAAAGAGIAYTRRKLG
jgi:hypothetical protein